MSEASEPQEPVLVAYVLQNSMATYWGELMNNDQDDFIYLSKPMVFIMQPPKDNSAEPKTFWSKAMACGKESLIGINPKSTPGLLVLNPDAELIAQYKNEYLQAYSKLTLLRP